MKFLFTIFLITSFIGVAVFGVFGMHSDMQNHDDGCIFAVSQRADCTKRINPIDYLAFHFDSFKNFLATTFNNNLFVLLLQLFVFIAGASFWAWRGAYLILLKFHPAHYFHRLELFKKHPQREFLKWLAFHENSPTFLRTLI